MDFTVEPNTLANGHIYNFIYNVADDGVDFEAALQKLKVEADKIGLRTDPKSKKKYKPSDAGRLARKAAEVLADRPWVQHRLGNKKGMCALGVLNLTVCGHIAVAKFHPLVAYTNELFAGWYGRTINGFNDLVATSKEDVIEMLLKFADHFDPKGARVK